MYEIEVTKPMQAAALDHDRFPGRRVIVPVKLDWPELRLTMDQLTANAFARAYGQPDVFPDHSIITLVFDR